MDLFLAICAAIGFGLAAGIGGPLAWLFIGVMASFQAGIDLRGTDFEFIGEPWFIAVLFAANVAQFLLRTKDFDRRIPYAASAFVFGGIFGAGALAAEGETAALGFVLGALAGLASGLLAHDVLEGASRRAESSDDSSAAATLQLIFGFAGIVTALAALYAPPLALLAAVALAVLAGGRRRRAGEKYEGLRVLR
ncbi:MAG TPA: hypothetical protein VKA36_06320 [Solirubrobacterales bacterium]|nr:hypothetical protein [Solirubrobacterales bacterium]